MKTVIISIVTAAITAFLTTLIKSYLDRVNYKAKLQRDLEFEQQKVVRNTISNYKGHLIESMSSLHNRLKYLAREEGYNKLSSDISIEDQLIKSTMYRFLSTFAWIHLINSELVHFDPTKAYQNDLTMLKYFKILPLIFQDRDLESGFKKDKLKESLIQRNVFEEMYKWMIENKSVIEYTTFLENYDKNKNHIAPLEKYIIGIDPNSKCTRWDRLFTFHLFIMAFLNRFGYDFQETDEAKMKKYISRQGQYTMFKNINKHLILKFKLEKEKELVKMMKISNYYIR